MKTLNRYIFLNLLVMTLMSLGILTFVMMSGQIFKIFDLILRGVSPSLLLKLIALLLPDMLRFTLPLSQLIATVLVFSRLSADSEVVAMKSMGISLWQIVSPAFLQSVLISLLCLWISLFVAPEMRNRADQLRMEALTGTPLSLIEPGSFSEIMPGCYLRVETRNGNQLTGVHISYRGKKNEEIREILADSGSISMNAEENVLELTLKNAKSFTTDLTPDSSKPKNPILLEAASIQVPLAYKTGGRKKILRKAKYLNLKQLCARYVRDKNLGLPVTEYLTLLHQKLALAISPISFLLIGLSFGIRSKRSELSIGLLICVLLAVLFYGFLMLGNALEHEAWLHPQYILWIPNFLYQIVGLWMIRKLEQCG